MRTNIEDLAKKAIFARWRENRWQECGMPKKSMAKMVENLRHFGHDGDNGKKIDGENGEKCITANGAHEHS